MKIKINKNGDVVYSKGLKTLITNMDARVDNDIFEAGASYRLTIYHFFFSKILMNSVVGALFVLILTLTICILVRELRVYVPMAVKASSIIAAVFASLLIYQHIFWKIFKK